MAYGKEVRMIERLIIFGAGLLIGALGAFAVIVLLTISGFSKMENPTKDEWRLP